jgi:hypothetical protein
MLDAMNPEVTMYQPLHEAEEEGLPLEHALDEGQPSDLPRPESWRHGRFRTGRFLGRATAGRTDGWASPRRELAAMHAQVAWIAP